jgi:glycosyltransferase involved in cell wall biosynthesis
MKIVHLIDYYQPAVGYQETFLAREHKKIGHQVYVVTSDRYFPFPSYGSVLKNILGKRIVGKGKRIEEGINVLRLPTIEILGGPIVLLEGLENALKKINPDLLLCHGMHSLTAALAGKIKKKLGYRLIYDTHAAPFNTNFNSSIIKRLYHVYFDNFIKPVVMNNADGIFAIGDDERDFICREYNLKSTRVPIIHLGIDKVRFQYSILQRRVLRKKLNLNQSDVLVVYAGKITPEKDIEILCEGLLKCKSDNIKLLLLGDGNGTYINKLKTKYNNALIIWLPLVPNKKLGGYYSAADIGVWPGNSSITILEAMSSRLPLILPSTSSTAFLDNSGGILRFPRGNSTRLAGIIKKLSKNDSLRRKIGRKSQNYVNTHLRWGIIARQILKLV